MDIRMTMATRDGVCHVRLRSAEEGRDDSKYPNRESGKTKGG